jgi:putative FmdB family regulatory protein
MPIYEYSCTKCGKVEEVIQNFSDKSLTKCRHCSGKLHKLISQSSFHLKGTGWYATDYAKKSQSPSAPAKKKEKTPIVDSTPSATDKNKSEKPAE